MILPKISAFYALFSEFALELESINNEFQHEEDAIPNYHSTENETRQEIAFNNKNETEKEEKDIFKTRYNYSFEAKWLFLISKLDTIIKKY